MLVSVIIPTFNRAKTIERTIASVLAQTWPHVETVVVDDGSVDETPKVVEKYGSEVRYIRQANGGPSAARNTGIRASTGQIVSFLDSDDEWLPEKLERQVDLLRRTYSYGVRTCICNAQMLAVDKSAVSSFTVAGLKPSHSQGVWTNPTEVLLTRFLFFNQVVAVWRETLLSAGCFRSDLRILEDYDLALRLSISPWAYSEEEMVIWHAGEANSLSQNVRNKEVWAKSLAILTQLGESPTWGRYLPEPLLRKRLSSLRTLLWAQNLGESKNAMACLVAKAVLYALQVKKQVSHRSPSFPTMEVIPIREIAT